MSEPCYICSSGNGELLEEHHIVPRRFGGGDESANTVDLCPNCHRALERLYDKRFYNAIGAKRVDDVETVIQAAEVAGGFVGRETAQGSAETVGPDGIGVRTVDAVLSEFGVEAMICERCGSLGRIHEVDENLVGCGVCSELQEPDPWQMLGASGDE